MRSYVWTKAYESRRSFIGGSDARIIMGSDEAALVRLWREKRGEAEPEDLSGNLIVQLGAATEDLNRSWYEYSEHFADDLAEILQDNFPEDQVNSAQTLAHECARNEAAANDKVKKILWGRGLNMDQVLDHAKGRKVKKLVQEYVRREPDAVTLVHKLLTDAGVSMDGLMADALAEKLDDIERIDRLISIVESRRNASLHEIKRRRAVLGETLRRSVQEIEDGEFKVIDTTPAQGENVA
jgi:hypothetical protein